MASFGKLVLTSEGIQAQALAQAGVGLKFSRIKMGDGSYSGNIASMNDLVRPKVALNITNGELKDNVYTVSAYFSNTELTEGFYWKELGVFIINASGKEVLYAYANAGSNYDYIPATEDEKFAKWIRVATAVGNATDISIVEDSGILYVDTLTFENYKEDAQSELYNGYKVVEGNSYAGIAGDYGIEVGKIEGKSVQDGTPTPDAPVEIKSFGDDGVNFVSHGFQLFDASKLPTREAGGAKVTNNGDGSFTVSGTGTMTDDFKSVMTYSHEETLAILKTGNIMFYAEQTTYPYMFVQFKNNDGTIFEFGNSSSASVTREILQTMLDDENTYMQVGFYGTPAGSQSGVIKAGTIKPMLYQDGDGTWEPFREPQSVSIAEPLRSLPNGVCDTYEDGKITRKVGNLILDGSEDISRYEVEQGVVYRFLSVVNDAYYNMYMKDNAYCSHYVQRTYETRENNSFYIFGDNNVDVLDDRFESVEAFKTWLTENPITVFYELATPIIEEVTLPTIPSYAPHTSVHHDSDVEPTSIEWHVLNGVPADHTKQFEYVLNFEDWEGEEAPFTQTIYRKAITADAMGVAGVSLSATQEQYMEAMKSNLRLTEQGVNEKGNGYIVVTAYGKKPEVDIPIVVQIN